MSADTRLAIIETVTALFWRADHHQWDALVEVFAPTVTLDYTALQGGAPAILGPDVIVGGWRAMFEALDAHQHLVANHLVTVEGDRAVATASYLATHMWRGDTWTIGGDYRFELTSVDRWRITAMTMTPTWQTGDLELVARATAAVEGAIADT